MSSTKQTSDLLLSLIERAERLHVERKANADDLRDVYAEARSQGFDVKALKTIVSIRTSGMEQYHEHSAIVDTYLHALGMILPQKNSDHHNNHVTNTDNEKAAA